MLRDLFSLFPAYAGVILRNRRHRMPKSPFPRIRGGDPHIENQTAMNFNLFPAYAGVILSFAHVYMNEISFPRIRGGDPKPSWTA